jgi:hypothetical protein
MHVDHSVEYEAGEGASTKWSRFRALMTAHVPDWRVLDCRPQPAYLLKPDRSRRLRPEEEALGRPMTEKSGLMSGRPGAYDRCQKGATIVGDGGRIKFAGVGLLEAVLAAIRLRSVR